MCIRDRITLERQQLALALTSLPEAERQNRLALQERVLDAVVSGRGWEELPEDVRAQAETCLLYTSPSPRDRTRYRMPSSA